MRVTPLYAAIMTTALSVGVGSYVTAGPHRGHGQEGRANLKTDLSAATQPAMLDRGPVNDHSNFFNSDNGSTGSHPGLLRRLLGDKVGKIVPTDPKENGTSGFFNTSQGTTGQNSASNTSSVHNGPSLVDANANSASPAVSASSSGGSVSASPASAPNDPGKPTLVIVPAALPSTGNDTSAVKLETPVPAATPDTSNLPVQEATPTEARGVLLQNDGENGVQVDSSVGKINTLFKGICDPGGPAGGG
jgi:hypothetical protein